jgi:bifunctional non-homologous end joining protein LigD
MVDQIRASDQLIRPMLATAGAVPTSPGWAFEIKFDGVRAVGYSGAGGLRLFSRNDRDVTTSYPEVAAAGLDDVRGDLVLDGELVALDDRGRPDFARLQHRMHVVRPASELLVEVPVQYVVFDLLRADGDSLLELPYRERRARLTGLGLDGHSGIRIPPNFIDVPGATVLAAAEQQGLEGVVAKRLESAYQPGRRARSWIKTAIRHAHEVIVVGWSPGNGNRQNSIGALLLGAHDGGRLVYVGDVGTGFTDAARARLLEQLRGLERTGSPFDGEIVAARGAWPGRAASRGPVRWVEPRLVGEIEYRAFTKDGYFRHPSWRGLRPDRDPDEVRLPLPT